MGDQPGSTSPPSRAPWLKAFLGTLAGLFSGAAMMYLSPLIDKVVKPAVPVANFGFDREGTTVTFYNRSSGGSDGWWDFGDGSPLEPVSAKQETIVHTYGGTGAYVVKLTLRNLIGDESQRSVNLQLDSAHAEVPEITSLEATPISAGAYAPATFRVVSRAKNARLCIWDFGDDRPLQINNETPASQDMLVTFPKPGGYMVKMAAVNGEQAKEKTAIVFVDEPPPGALTAILHVTDQATRLEKEETSIPVTVVFPPHYGEDSYRFDEPVPAKPGFEITAARFETVNDLGSTGLDLRVASDRRTARLTGTLVKSGGLFKRSTQAPNLLVRVVLNQEFRVPAIRSPVSVTAVMKLPGSIALPLPALPENWIDPQRQLRLEMRDGDRVVFQESQLPRRAPLEIQKHRCTLTATPVGDQVRVDLAEAAPVISLTGN